MDLFSLLAANQPPERQFEDAIISNNIKKVEELIQSGFNVNTRIHRQGGDAALHIAAGHGNFVMVQALLKSGADPNKTNDFKHTPVFLAFRKGHMRAMEILLTESSVVTGLDYVWSKEEWTKVIWSLTTTDATEKQFFMLLRMTPNLMMCRENVRINLSQKCIEGRMFNVLKLWFLSGNTLPADNIHRMKAIGDKDFDEWHKSFLSTPQKLQHFCRLAIRRSFNAKCNVLYGTERLPLPTLLKDYICFKNYDKLS